MTREFSLRSRRKLKTGDAPRFAGHGADCFGELAAVVCSTGMLSAKELHESWQMANCVHRAFPDSLRVADVAAGHGLLAWILVLLARAAEPATPRTAVAVDVTRPKSADILAAAMTARWPELAEAVHYVEGSVDAVVAADGAPTLLVAAHACGSLSDRVLLAAISSRSPVAIMPCCHSLRKQAQSLASLACAAGLPPASVENVLGQPASIDQFRVAALAALGYEIRADSIQAEITAFNRVIMGKPPAAMEQRALPARRVLPTEGRRKRLGGVRAYETVQTLDVSNAAEARAMAKRPSLEWRRSFDLSYWVDDEAMGRNLAAALERLTGRFASPGATREVSVHDRYSDPVTRRLAFTYRIEIGSAAVELTKADANVLRAKLCRGVACLAQLRRSNFVLRGGPR